MGQNS